MIKGIIGLLGKGLNWLWSQFCKKTSGSPTSIEVKANKISAPIAGHDINTGGAPIITTINNNMFVREEDKLKKAQLGAQASNIKSESGLIQDNDIQIHISPTRNGYRQLAQIQVLNIGQRPVLLDAWFVMWDDNTASIGECCERGRFPVRLQDQERADFIVDISSHPIEQLKALGVVDAGKRHLNADVTKLKQFIHTAKLHQPPKIDPPPKEEPSNVSIIVTIANSGINMPKRLEVRFKNLGPHDLHPQSAHVEWCYEPPRKMYSEPGKPKVMESGWSIPLRCDKPLQILTPNSEIVFFLSSRDSFAQAIVAVLAKDIPSDKLQVKVNASRWQWTAFGDEIPNTIREFAQMILREMK